MNPKFGLWTTRFLVYPSVLFALLSVHTQLGKLDFGDAAKLLLSVIAILASTSALCFNMARNIDGERAKKNLNYSGEKFFHCVLLFIQVLVLHFCITSIGRGSSSAVFAATTLEVIRSLVGFWALWQFAYGYEFLNHVLWSRYQERWEAFHAPPIVEKLSTEEKKT